MSTQDTLKDLYGEDVKIPRQLFDETISILSYCSVVFNDSRFTDRHGTGPKIKDVLAKLRQQERR